MSVLRAAMAYVTLRRRKDMVASSVKLVKRTVKIEAIPFEDGHHRSIHDVLYTSGKLCDDLLSAAIRGKGTNRFPKIQHELSLTASFLLETTWSWKTTCILLH